MRTALVAAVVGLAGLPACGLAPEPPTAAPVVGDGIAPWTELGPAQVCLGEQALGPPASPPGGLCVSPLSPGHEACGSDAGCASREACVCGRCAIPYCAVSSDCAAPRICNFNQHRCDLPCDRASQCSAGEQCLSGVCRGRCVDSSDCQHDEVCDGSHVCIGDDCADDAGCFLGEHCDLQRTPRQVLEPGPVAGAGGEIVVYLDLALPATPDRRAIWRATSRDGLHFTLDLQPVLDDPLGARAPSAIRDGGRVYVYFEQGDGAALRVASSADGVTFDPPVTVLTGGAAKLHAPSAIHATGRVALYYQHDDGDGIGLATGAPGGAVADQGIVLRPAEVEVGTGAPGTAFWTPVTTVRSPHAVLSGDTIHLFYSAFGQESAPAEKYGVSTPIPPNYSIGFAAATPAAPETLAVWPYGPVADRVEAFFDHRDDLGPGVVDDGAGGFLMYDIDATPTLLGRLEVLGSGTRGN